MTIEKGFARRMLFMAAAPFLFVVACTGEPEAAVNNEDPQAFDAAKEEQAIRQIFVRGQAAWKRGDIDAFMKGMWVDESTVHIFNEEITVGHAAIRERYSSRYTDPDRMGELTTKDMVVKVLSPDIAYVYSRWNFTHPDIAFDGVFTLVLRKIDGEWLIVHDHSQATIPASPVQVSQPSS